MSTEENNLTSAQAATTNNSPNNDATTPSPTTDTTPDAASSTATAHAVAANGMNGESTGQAAQTARAVPEETSPSTEANNVSVEADATPDTAPDASPSRTSTASASSFNKTKAMDDDDEDGGGMGDMDFGALLDQFEQEQKAYTEGEVVRGTVVGITERGAMIDFGFKSEGVVPREEFADGVIDVKPGEEVEIIVKSMDSPEGYPILSRADAVRMRAWDDLDKAFREETPIKGRVIERVKGGLRVDINGVAAFLPGSQIDVRPIRNLDVFRDQEIEAIVIKLNRKRANVVLSRKALLEESNTSRKEETLDNLEEGIIVEGQLKNLTDYGAFVDLGGVDGLLHVTDMSWGRLANPAGMFKVNDHVQVKVLKFDRQRERVSLGYKQLLPDPWESAEERYPRGMRTHGRVASVTDYGAFIELEAGVEGLVHVSEMSWSKRMKHPSKMVNPDDEVEVEVLGVDTRARRISLGMKQMQQNPWETLSARYVPGMRVKGRVRNLTDFGAFVEVEDGVDGLVHVSDISWSKRIKHPAEILKKGQEIEAVITNIDTENRRLSLSIKDMEPSAWDQFTETHKPGDIVRGRITRFANFGVFVEIAEGLEGLCHVSELSDERVERPEDIVKIGDELEFKILRVEPESHKIGLSARTSVKEEPVAADTRTYSSERGGGMASLSELADFRIGMPKEDEPREAELRDAKPTEDEPKEAESMADEPEKVEEAQAEQ
ncbi:MAG: 30S ribosomal protein S1 [Pyrinomonadaceae bacterium MAG19_C2-C3]|nr:30S ribosomal protein S1 [Pyrinomonadaceae bacterium MAG19_C2-C3]